MKKNGFTLIELLVVIAIIASIVSLAIPNYLGARQRARDSKRKSEMVSLKAALRLYYNDFQIFPANVSEGAGIQGCGAGGTELCPCGLVDFASGASCDNLYMKKFPSDFGTSMVYFQAANGDDFCLAVTLDNVSDPDIAASQSRCASACGANCTGGASTGRYCVCAD